MSYIQHAIDSCAMNLMLFLEFQQMILIQYLIDFQSKSLQVNSQGWVKQFIKDILNNDGFIDLADVYESLAFFALFSGDSFENKIQFIFRLFDFNSSDSIEKSELILTITSVIKSLCKINKVSVPKTEFLESLADACFLMIDKDHSKHIDVQEFNNWVFSNSEFQEFLLKFSGTQSFPCAKKIMDSLLANYEKGFQKICTENNTITQIQVKDLLQTLLQEFNQQELIDQLYEAIIETSQRYSDINSLTEIPSNLIHKRDYLEVMKAWSSFSACDIFNKNQLSIKELRILFWVYENIEPTTFKLIAEMQNIDEDKSLIVHRKKWIHYLCCEERTGGNVFKESLKRYFQKFTKESNGIIDSIYIKDILKEVFRQKVIKNQNNSTALESIDKVIEKLCTDISKDLRHKELSSISCNDFIFYVEAAVDKNKKLCSHLDSQF